MTNTEQLFIRACKSKHPSIRVMSVYRRFYFNYKLYHMEEAEVKKHIINILSEICDKYCKFRIAELLSEQLTYMYTYGNDFDTSCFKILISKIRLTEISKFPGYIVPAKFRNYKDGHATPESRPR